MFNLMFKKAKCEDARNFPHLDEKLTHTHMHTLYSAQCTQRLPFCDNTQHLMHEYELDFKVQEREWKFVLSKAAILPKCVCVQHIHTKTDAYAQTLTV